MESRAWRKALRPSPVRPERFSSGSQVNELAGIRAYIHRRRRMKRLITRIVAIGSGLLFATTSLQAATLGTSFTFQGQLKDGGSPANGAYDLQFKLFDALTSGTQVGSTQCQDNVSVAGGVGEYVYGREERDF